MLKCLLTEILKSQIDTSFFVLKCLISGSFHDEGHTVNGSEAVGRGERSGQGKIHWNFYLKGLSYTRYWLVNGVTLSWIESQ